MKTVIYAASILSLLMIFTIAARPQDVQTTKQVAAPLPKLALLGAEPHQRGGKKYSRIIMTVTNWNKYATSMFEGGSGVPQGQCATAKTRIVGAVYGEQGQPVAKCIQFPSPGAMQTFSYLVDPDGKTLPKFVYLVITDVKTGGAYRSNLASPWNGTLK